MTGTKWSAGTKKFGVLQFTDFKARMPEVLINE